MWELIRANRRKSAFLFVLLGACLVLIGYAAGTYYYPGEGGIIGILFAMTLWLALSSTAYWAGDSILLSFGSAREVTPEVHPRLYNVVEEMKIAAGLPVMPKIYIIDEEAMNAFAVGRNPNDCAIAVTAGLVSRLNRDELQGVVAHEMAHIENRDTLYMTFAGVTLGAITMISEIFFRTGRIGAMRYRFKSSRSGGGAAQLLIPIVAILAVLAGTIMAWFLYYSISRRREYLADASAVRLTRYPDGLASALEKISMDATPLISASKVTAPMYITNPFSGDNPTKLDWESTHPPIDERIRILRNMASGAGYDDYQNAFSKVAQNPGAILPRSALGEKELISIRKKASETELALDKKSSHRALGDLLMTVNGYLFLNCACGLKIKIPPDKFRTQVICPMCGKEYKVPQNTD